MKACVVGATGLVGAEFLELIPWAWPDCTIDLYASKTQQFLHSGKQYAVSAAEELERSNAPSGDLAFVALDDEHSTRYVPRLLELGYRVIDKSNTFRANPAVPLVVSGVNCHLVGDHHLVANPNCTTIPLPTFLPVPHRPSCLQNFVVTTSTPVHSPGTRTL